MWGWSQGGLKSIVFNQPMLRGDLAQPWFLPPMLLSSLWGDSLVFFHHVGVKPWFGDVPTPSLLHCFEAPVVVGMEAGSVPAGQPSE